MIASANTKPTLVASQIALLDKLRSEGTLKAAMIKPAIKKRIPINNKGGNPLNASFEKIQPAADSRVTNSRSRSAKSCSNSVVKFYDGNEMKL